jgi:MFS family permease
MTADVRRILGAQALRAASYGFGAVLLGSSLEARGWTTAEVGFLLTAIVAGTALMSLVVGTYADRMGRRRLFGLLYVGMAGAGAAFGLSDSLWVLVVAGLTGTLSPEVVESGPFTSLEQPMLSAELSGEERTRIFGLYNAVATLVGSLGALLAGGPALLRQLWPGLPPDHRWFLIYVPFGVAGALVALSLSDRVEERTREGSSGKPLRRSRRRVLGLSGLFALDSLGGGFVVQSFIAYWFALRFDTSLEALGAIFFGVGLLQAASFLVATRLARRFGLLRTMVFTHLPSNLLLAAIPLAPTMPLAVIVLFARFALSQMDVPTRQAYVMALVDPSERSAAAAYTNAARYSVRPLGPVAAGFAQQIAVGMPFFLAGGIKVVYDLALFLRFRRVPLAEKG